MTIITTATTSTAASLALVASLGAGACSKASERARDERQMIAALTEARDAVCACRELTCAEDAEQRLADFLLLHVDSLKKVPPPRGDTARAAIASQAARIDSELRACKRRLEEAAHAN